MLSDNEPARVMDGSAMEQMSGEVSIPGGATTRNSRTMVRHCPGGRLELWDKATGDSSEDHSPLGLAD